MTETPTKSFEDLFGRGGLDDTDKNDRARRAINAFRALQPTLTAYARVLTRNNRVRVEMAARDNGSTDGTRIFYRPPIALGDPTTHNRHLCDKRDATHQLLCPACNIREEVLVVIYHEIAHIAFGSFTPPGDQDIADIIKEAVRMSGGWYGEVVRKRIETAPDFKTRDFINLASLVSEFLPIVYNALEDARVNRELFRARQGVKVMFNADTWRVFTNGVEQKTPDGKVIVKMWTEYPLNMQVIIGLFCRASGYDYSNWLVPEVVEALRDRELGVLINKMSTVRSTADVYRLSFPILARLVELGFCKEERDEPQAEPEPSPKSEESTEEKDETEDPEGESEKDDTEDDSDGDNSDSSEPTDGSDESDDEPSPSGSSEPNDDSNSDSDESEETDTDTGEAEENDDEDSADEEGEGGSDPGGSDDSGDGEGGGEGSGGSGSDGPGGPSDSGTDSDDADYRDFDGDSDTRDADADESGEADAGSESPADATGVAGTDEKTDTETSNKGSGSTPTLETKSSSEGPAGSGDSDTSGYNQDEETDAIDTGADDGTGGVEVEENPANENIPMGTAKEAFDGLIEWGGHADKPKTIAEKEAEEAEDNAMDRAIIQGIYFETPSRNVFGVREHHYGRPQMAGSYNMSRGWDSSHSVWTTRARSAYGIDAEPDTDEKLLGPALMKLRVALADNQRSHDSRNRKSGKIDARVLGKRAPFNDNRMFKKRTVPGKRDYFVVIGIDISGSTSGLNLILAKKAAFAQASLLTRMGIPFAMYGHSGNYHSPLDGREGGLDVDIYIIKEAEEVWNNAIQDRLRAIGPDAANLDGHTMEYYRKVLDRHQATDKIILYYTDGKMPAENFTEELEVLQRELKICKQKGYHVLGVGIRTDSPRKHGLNTVQVDEEKDVELVIAQLRKELLAASAANR